MASTVVFNSLAIIIIIPREKIVINLDELVKLFCL